MARLTRFFTRYYVLNLLVAASYFVVRTFYPYADVRKTSEFLGITREQEIALIGCVALAQRYMKTTTLDEFMGSIVLFAKTIVVAEMFFVDKRIMCWYLIAYFILFFTVPRARFTGDRNVKVLNLATLKNKIVNGDKDTVWVVLFRASWSGHCDNFDPVFADLSLKYSTRNMKFAEIDVARWSEAAKEFDIDTSGTSLQLPSVILFERGQEHSRLPPFNPDGTVAPTKLDEPGLVKYFFLDRRIIDQLNSNHSNNNKPSARSKQRRKK